MNIMTIFIILQGCEVAPDINIANSKYGIHLSVPSADGMSDLWLKCDSVKLLLLKLPNFIFQFYLFQENVISECLSNSFLQEQQYARWMAACRMAAKGKSMADRGYDAEVKSIQAFLSMQVYLSKSTPFLYYIFDFYLDTIN